MLKALKILNWGYLKMFKKKELSAAQIEAVETKDFFDRIVPGVIRFYTAFGGQKRRDLTHLQPPCYKHGAKKNRSAGDAQEPYDDHHKRC